MDDHDKERFIELGMLVFGAFDLIRELLTGLPIPVELPDIDPGPEGGDRAEVLLSLDRARAVIKDEPISTGVKVSYEMLILDWFTAYEMLTLTRVAGPAPWRLDSAEHALTRLELTAEAIENGETDIDDKS